MSKFFITNSKSHFLKLKKIVDSSPFEICYTYEGDICCLTTKKLTVKHINGKTVDKGFVVVTGTMIWGEGLKVDGDVLNAIRKDFKGEPNAIRDSSVGNYAVSIVENNQGCVFTDLSGFYNVYYYNNNGIWAISNSLYDLFLMLKESLSLDELSIVEFIRQNSILGGDTQFNEIKRLRGYDYLKFDINGITHIIEDHQYPLAKGTFEEKIGRYVDFSKNYASKTYKAFGKPTIAMTGGLDARMLLASYLAIGVKPDLYYGTGNSLITNTKAQDKIIDRQYSQKFNLKLFEESWETPDPMDKYWDKYLQLFGFSYFIYASSNAVMESVIKNPNSYFILGEGGEMLRNQVWIDERNIDYFTLDEFINEYYTPQTIKDSIICVDDYMHRIRNKYLDVCNYYHLNPEHIASEDIFLLILEYRKMGDSETVNWMNYIRYDSIQMIQYQGLLAARLGYKDTANAKFMLYCQEKLYPPVLDVPVFSHCHLREFHRDTMTISSKTSFVQYLKNHLRNAFPFLVKLNRKYLYKDQAHSNSTNLSIYNYALQLYEKYDKPNLFNIEKFTDQRSLIKYIMFLNAITKLK